mmetsp:Transcript_7859/g.9101  ORF Transcript_7859/g.9101 Transcript_7859/m.9101 type:complete len:164 (+) Transcript_7859:31-522(+)
MNQVIQTTNCPKTVGAAASLTLEESVQTSFDNFGHHQRTSPVSYSPIPSASDGSLVFDAPPMLRMRSRSSHREFTPNTTSLSPDASNENHMLPFLPLDGPKDRKVPRLIPRVRQTEDALYQSFSDEQVESLQSIPVAACEVFSSPRIGQEAPRNYLFRPIQRN